MKTTITLFSFLFFILNSNGQEEAKSPHHVGVHAGSTTGLVFSYRYWPNSFGLQATALPIFSKNQTTVSSGLSLLYLLRDNQRVDLFGYLGNHFLYNSSSYEYFDPNTGNIKKEQSSNYMYNVGIGLGLKISIWEVVNLNFQAGYGLYNITNGINTNIAGEFGLYYNL